MERKRGIVPSKFRENYLNELVSERASIFYKLVSERPFNFYKLVSEQISTSCEGVKRLATKFRTGVHVGYKSINAKD